MALTIEKLSKRAGDRWLLRDVNFSAEAGKIFGIVGVDNESNLMLLQIIAGTEQANSGKILVDQAELKPDGITFLTNQNNSSGWKSLFKKSSEENENLFYFFSQRLKQSEQVVLIDYALNCCSRNEKSKFLENLREAAAQKNLTVILTTDDDEIIFGCDVLAVLEKGEIVQTGTPREIYESPESAAAAKAVGRMNFIEARRLSSSKSEAPEFQTIRGEHRLFTARQEKQRLGAINQNITLAIRPEHISISFGASFPEDNLIKAKIAKIKFQGATTLIKLDAEGLILEAVVLRLVGLNVGDECMVGLPPDRISILKQ